MPPVRCDSPGRVTFRPCELTHLRTAGTSSAFPPLPSTTNGLIAPGPSHFTVGQLDLSILAKYSLPSSLAQFPTSEVGHATIAFSHVGFPAIGDCFNKVHSRAMHCNVFPAPVSSILLESRRVAHPDPSHQP